jgi:inhibitor of cysteine peptidase
MKLKTTISILIFAVMFILITISPGFCEGVKQTINKKNTAYTDPEKTIQCSVDEEFSIVLDSNPTTGYQWQLARPTDEKTLNLIDKKYKAPKPQLAGAGGQEVWSFKALSAGKTTIVFEYRRPWEKEKGPVKSMSFIINIQ